MIEKFLEDVGAFGVKFKLNPYWVAEFKASSIRVCKQCLNPKYEKAFTGSNPLCKCCARPSSREIDSKARQAAQKAWRDNQQGRMVPGSFCIIPSP